MIIGVLKNKQKYFLEQIGYEILNTINEKNSVENRCEILDITIDHTSINANLDITL